MLWSRLLEYPGSVTLFFEVPIAAWDRGFMDRFGSNSTCIAINARPSFRQQRRSLLFSFGETIQTDKSLHQCNRDIRSLSYYISLQIEFVSHLAAVAPILDP